MLITITPNKEKAQSIRKMVDTTLEMISTVDNQKFSSNIIKEYYESIRELFSIILLLDGYKTYGEGAHKELIEYIQEHYTQFTQQEIQLVDKLRTIRNKIAYDGFFVNPDFVTRNKEVINLIITKAKKIIDTK